MSIGCSLFLGFENDKKKVRTGKSCQRGLEMLSPGMFSLIFFFCAAK